MKLSLFMFFVGALFGAFLLNTYQYFSHNDLNSPLVNLNDPHSFYRLRKMGESLWIEQLKEAQKNQVPEQGKFSGSAVKVSGSCFDPHEFIDKNVQVKGFFTKETGEHSFYLSEIRVEQE